MMPSIRSERPQSVSRALGLDPGQVAAQVVLPNGGKGCGGSALGRGLLAQREWRAS